jgi:hypothetical protein
MLFSYYNRETEKRNIVSNIDCQLLTFFLICESLFFLFIQESKNLFEMIHSES